LRLFLPLLIQSEHPLLKGRLRGPFSFCEIAVRRRPRITRARLRALLHYDRETGEFRWRKRMNARVRAGHIAGTLTRDGYRVIAINGRPYRAHRLAWLYVTGKWCSLVIDHRDGDPSNNRWNNLRRATRSQNSANRRVPRNNASGLKGVSRYQGRWRATIHKEGRRHYLGIFSTREAAHAAYEAAARKLFGEFARTK
jgi:HNH endonuclease/AP2 domain